MADNKTFEQKFSQMAEIHVKDRVPSLMDYWVGFQLIHKSEDEKNATGIMAFIVNKLWVYIPVIFIKGDLKGDEIMYIQNVDLRIPAQDNWITTLKEKGMSFIGSIVKDRDRGNEEEYDSLEDISIPVEEFTIKQASEDQLMSPEEAQKLFSHIRRPQKGFLEKLSEMGDKHILTFAKTFLSNPDMANSVFKFHSPEELQKLSSMIADVADKNTPSSPEKKVTYITDIQQKEAKELKNSEKTQLVRNGMFIKDERKNTSKLFKTASPEGYFTNPDSAGVYQVLMKDGSYKDYYILPYRGDGTSSIMIKDGKGSFQPRKNIFARQKLSEEGPEFSEASKKSLMEGLSDNNAVVIKQKGKAYLIHDKTDDGKVMINNIGSPCNPVFTGSSGNLSIHKDVLIVPKEAKILKITYEEPEELGDFRTIQNAINTNGELTPLEVQDRPETGVTVKTAGEKKDFVDKFSAVKCLIEDFGIYAGQAQTIMKEAGREGKAEYLVKTAADSPYNFGDHGGVTAAVSATEQQASEETITNPPMDPMPEKVVQDLTQIADKGISEVFDTSVFQSLLQSAGVSDFKQEFIVDMVKGMDSSAGMLLLLYWNYDMFEERYGDDLQEMEEKLKEIFKTSGDVILFIKEKTESLPEGGESVWGLLSEDIF